GGDGLRQGREKGRPDRHPGAVDGERVLRRQGHEDAVRDGEREPLRGEDAGEGRGAAVTVRAGSVSDGVGRDPSLTLPARTDTTSLRRGLQLREPLPQFRQLPRTGRVLRQVVDLAG